MQLDMDNWCTLQLLYLNEGLICAEKTTDSKLIVLITQMLLSFHLYLKELWNTWTWKGLLEVAYINTPAHSRVN